MLALTKESVLGLVFAGEKLSKKYKINRILNFKEILMNL